jgi:hypothetical protein
MRTDLGFYRKRMANGKGPSIDGVFAENIYLRQTASNGVRCHRGPYSPTSGVLKRGNSGFGNDSGLGLTATTRTLRGRLGRAGSNLVSPSSRGHGPTFT